MHELLPIVSGILAGAALGSIRPTWRLPIGLVVAIILGIVATIVSGEFRVSWAYLFIDIPLVAVSAAAGLLVARRLRQTLAHVDDQPG
jgi:hypothetical protein